MPGGHRFPSSWNETNRSKNKSYRMHIDIGGSSNQETKYSGSDDGHDYWETVSRYPVLELMSYFAASLVCCCCSALTEKCLLSFFKLCPERPGDLETFDHLIFKGDTANNDETDSQQSGIIGRTIDLLKLVDPTRKKIDVRYTSQYKKKRRRKKRKKKEILDISNAVGIDQMV